MMLKKPFTEKAAEKVAENGIVQNKFRVIIVDVVVCFRRKEADTDILIPNQFIPNQMNFRL